MEENEAYLGGFYSMMQLSIGTYGAGRTGAGIYATNKRLFIFRIKDMDMLLNKIVTGSSRKDFNPASITPEQNQKIIETLSHHSIESPGQLCIAKDQLSSLEMKEPPGIFRTGYLNLIDTSGKNLKVTIGKKKEYEYVLSLLQRFDLQIVKEVQ